MYHEKLLENIIEKILECKKEIIAIEESQYEELREAYANDYYFRYNIRDHHYFFSLEVLKKWRDLVIQISNKVFKDQFSLTYIDKALRSYFDSHYHEHNLENLAIFLSEIKSNASDLLFCIPIYGIELSNQKLNIGNFSFKTIEKVKEEISEITPSLNLEIMLDSTISPNQVLLINNYQTDSDKALDITLNQTNRLIDILNWKFSQLAQPTDDSKYIISLQKPRRDQLKYFSLSNKKTITTNFKNIFSTFPLDLNINVIEMHICSDEVLWLVSLISEDKINDYHDAILKAIHWFSKFWTEKQSDNKLLYLAIALEALLSEAFATSSFVSDRVAFILGRDKEERLRLRDLTKKLYDLRSDIAHGNNINIVQEGDLHQLEIITRHIIQYTLNNRNTFNKLRDFKQNIDNKKYA